MSLNDTQEDPLRFQVIAAALGGLLMVAGCAFPPERVVTGVLARIERRQDLESVCHIGVGVHDPNACHEPPVCCSYRLTVRDSTGREEYFFAFWPDYAPGLKWMELRLLKFHLHREEITEFPCTMYGCRTFLDYALTSDDDWRLLQ